MSFLTSVPSLEDQMATIDTQDIIVKNPGTQMRLKHAPESQRLRRTDEKGKRSSYTLTKLPHARLTQRLTKMNHLDLWSVQ